MADLPTTYPGKPPPQTSPSPLTSQLTPSPLPDPINIAVIGGTGLQSLAGYVPVATLSPTTPWGAPSSPISILEHNKTPIAFLSRHGLHHQYAPHEVPNRANIAALRSLGVRTIIAFSAVGSLREEIKPRDFVVPDQVIDRTKGRYLFSAF
jgi:5'-methylthioadenosine phosphorylase